jgi:ssDNA-binding Zn-finger/Zn-ribbon topoisomerase 1
VELSKYGWFWECPSGPSCHYRHALPPGFMLKRDKKLLKELEEDKPSLEEWIETERHKLDSSKLTKVTLETFVAWKKRKIQEKKDNKLKIEQKKLRDFKEGNRVGVCNLFYFFSAINQLTIIN